MTAFDGVLRCGRPTACGVRMPQVARRLRRHRRILIEGLNVRNGRESGPYELPNETSLGADASRRDDKAMKKLSWILRLTAAGILLQTLFFKFTGAPESVHIFSTIGIEPWGRFLSGAFELVAAILLVVPATAALGAVMAIGLMLGALGSHALFLGVDVMGDGGLLFALAWVTLLASVGTLWIRPTERASEQGALL